ncbi:MAG: hypothetical protein GXX94_07425 [Chloroflexi bacterium]|nr:hypothetical protein [Chloroflexota bacterium]
MTESYPPRTILLADIGTTWTHVGLVERVAGAFRLAARVDSATQSADRVDLASSLTAALERMQEIARRPLLSDDGSPVLPRERERGSDLLVVTTSAGGPLRCGIIGLTPELSLEPGRQACALSGTQIVSEIGLAEERPRRHRALAGLRAALPDVVVMLGGVDGGPSRPFSAAASVLSTLYADVPADQRPVVVFAGNLEARRPVAEALGRGFDYRVVENIHPRLGETSPQELQRELERIHVERRLPQLPGYAEISGWSALPITATGTGTAVILEFLSRQGRYGGSVLGVDVGAASTLVAVAGEGPYVIQAAGSGTSRGLEQLLEDQGMASIQRWLPSPHLEATAAAILRNRALRPQTLPEDARESTIILAAAREALRRPLQTLDTLTNGATSEAHLIAARGGSITRSGRDSQAMLALIDAIQPSGLTRVVSDWASVWAPLGILARREPLAALQVLQRDAVRELGTVLSIEGHGPSGQPAVRLRLECTGEIIEANVPWGSLARIPVEAQAELRAWPGNEPAAIGAAPIRAALAPGTVGLVVDARGRPLQLPESDAARQGELEKWLSALG